MNARRHAPAPFSRGERAALIDACSHNIRRVGRRLYAVDLTGPFHSQSVIERLYDRGLLMRVRPSQYRAVRGVFP